MWNGNLVATAAEDLILINLNREGCIRSVEFRTWEPCPNFNISYHIKETCAEIICRRTFQITDYNFDLYVRPICLNVVAYSAI
jgi:hypothetical protein